MLRESWIFYSVIADFRFWEKEGVCKYSSADQGILSLKKDDIGVIEVIGAH